MKVLDELERFQEAALKDKTLGGGENSPMLENEDDYYSLFMAAIEHSS